MRHSWVAFLFGTAMYQDLDHDLLPHDSDANDLPTSHVLGGTFHYLGEALTAEAFVRYVATYDFGPVAPDFVVLHHTAIPDASWAPVPGRPASKRWDAGEAGLNESQITAKRLRQLGRIRDHYRDNLRWDRGPQIFIDERSIYLFSPMNDIGIHAAGGNYYHADGKLHYSIGVEVVGYFRHYQWPPAIVRNVGLAIAALQQRLGTFKLAYTVRAGGISSHRDYGKPECPGAAITNAYYVAVVQQAAKQLQPPLPPPAPTPAPAPAPVTRLNADSSILHAPRCDAGRALAYLLKRGSAYDPQSLKTIVEHYWRYAPAIGIDPLIALAQSIKETSERWPTANDPYRPFSSWWAVRPRRNPAGIGVNGDTEPQRPATGAWEYNDVTRLWEAGCRYDSWDAAVQDQLGRLLAYAVTPGQETPEQRELIVRAIGHRPLPRAAFGSAPTLKPLGALHNPANAGKPRKGWVAGWAWDGATYGASIAAIAQTILDAQA